ncbi:MAG: SRPBCC family protein [Candidatus Omnitrophota bacterium]
MISRTLTITIDSPAARVYDFIRNPGNMPRWATTFCRSMKRVRGAWIIGTTQGPLKLRIAQKNRYGILDHYISQAGAAEVFVPLRVVPNGTGSEVIFTLFQRPGMTGKDFIKDAGLVRKDLRSLKRVLER